MGCVVCNLAEMSVEANGHGWVAAPFAPDDMSRLVVVPRRHTRSLQELVHGAPALVRLLDYACERVKREACAGLVSVTAYIGESMPHVYLNVEACFAEESDKRTSDIVAEYLREAAAAPS